MHVRHEPLPCREQMGLHHARSSGWDGKELRLQDVLATRLSDIAH